MKHGGGWLKYVSVLLEQTLRGVFLNQRLASKNEVIRAKSAAPSMCQALLPAPRRSRFALSILSSLKSMERERRQGARLQFVVTSTSDINRAMQTLMKIQKAGEQIVVFVNNATRQSNEGKMSADEWKYVDEKHKELS